MQKIVEEQEVTSKKFEILQKSLAKSNEEEALLKSKISNLTTTNKSLDYKVQAALREKKTLQDQLNSNKYQKKTLSKAKQDLFKEEKALFCQIHDKEVESQKIENELEKIDKDEQNIKKHNDELKSLLDNSLKELKAKEDRIEKYMLQIQKKNVEIE